MATVGLEAWASVWASDTEWPPTNLRYTTPVPCTPRPPPPITSPKPTMPPTTLTPPMAVAMATTTTTCMARCIHLLTSITPTRGLTTTRYLATAIRRTSIHLDQVQLPRPTKLRTVSHKASRQPPRGRSGRQGQHTFTVTHSKAPRARTSRWRTGESRLSVVHTTRERSGQRMHATTILSGVARSTASGTSGPTTRLRMSVTLVGG
jgi:hypothetical protein